MSLNRDNKSPASIIGAAIGVLAALPVAMVLASLLGNSYESRAWIYILTLCWAIVGAISLVVTTSKKNTNVTAKRIGLWIICVWIWPVLLLVSAKDKRN